MECDDGSGMKFPMVIKYGEFGEADPEVEEISGQKINNIKMILSLAPFEDEGDLETLKPGQFATLGVIHEEGRRVTMKGQTGLGSLIKITEQELEELLNDWDPIEAPPGDYKVQPEKPGKIIWLTGAPGMGKSTSAQILGRDYGHVYYEADCFGGLKNPYVPLNVDNPTMAQIHQKQLGGPGKEERKAMIERTMVIWADMMAGKEYNVELMLEFYEHLALDIKREKKRIGGDFAIATVLLKKDARTLMRKILGDQLVIVSLTMSMEERRKRVLARHSGDEASADLMDHFATIMEPLEASEPNSVELEVTGDMTRDEVVHEILRRVQQMDAETRRLWGEHLTE